MPSTLQDKVHITLIGQSDGQDAVLAEILAEQSKTKPEFDFVTATDSASASTHSDVWLVCNENNPAHPSPLCIRIYEKNAVPSAELYFVKPFRLAELLETAITRAKLRRMKQPRKLNSGFIFKPFARLIENVANGQNVTLTEKEASFLCAVLDTGDAGLPRMQAMTEIWGYHPDAQSHAVDTTLYRLRQKLDELGADSARLINEGGLYKWQIT
jgi:Transcriptional regulatory protein, C terminal